MVFGEFWWILGSKLGRKMEPKSIQKGIEKTMKKWKAPRWPKGRSKERRRTLGRCGAGSTRRKTFPAVPQGRPSSRKKKVSKLNTVTIKALTRLGPLARRIFIEFYSVFHWGSVVLIGSHWFSLNFDGFHKIHWFCPEPLS